MKGFFQNSTVLVFNWNENPVPAVNRETLGNLHSIMTQKNQVGVINVSQVRQLLFNTDLSRLESGTGSTKNARHGF